MMVPFPRRMWLFAFIAIALVVVACGGETVPTSVGASVVVPVTDAADSTPEAGDDPVTASAGVFTIGDQTWQFRSRQCDVFAVDTVSIWGEAESDSDVGITFDVFAADRFGFSANVRGVEWTAESDDIEVTVDGQDVTGTATVSDIVSGESRSAIFEFHCG